MFPCGLTSTISHLYVLFCVLPLVLRKSGDFAFWGRKIVREKKRSWTSSVYRQGWKHVLASWRAEES